MKSPLLTLGLAALLAIILLVASVVRPNPAQPNWEIMPEMARSPALQAFEATREFSNGRTQQSPVPGSIARGLSPLHFTASKEDALRAGEELRNPFRQYPAAASSPAEQGSQIPDPRSAWVATTQRGERLYKVYCQSCHGVGGAGDGPVALRGFPPPPPLPTGKSTQMKDGQLFHILTYGQGSMPAMAAQLDREQRWDVVNFVRSLQSAAERQNAPPQPAAPLAPPTPSTVP